MKKKADISTETEKKGQKSKSCSWLVLKSHYKNIILPGERLSLSLYEPNKRLGDLEEEQNFDFDGSDYESTNFERMMDIKPDSLFVLFPETDYLSSVLNNLADGVLEDTIADIYKTFPKYFVGLDEEAPLLDVMYIPGVVCCAKSEPEPIPVSDRSINERIEKMDAYQSIQYLKSNFRYDMEVLAVAKVRVPLRAFNANNLAKKIKFDCRKAITEYSKNLNRELEIEGNPHTLRALVERVCESFNLIEMKKMQIMTRQKSKIALSMIEHDKSKTGEFIDSVVDELGSEVSYDKMNSSLALDDNRSWGPSDPLDFVARQIFINPYVSNSSSSDSTFDKFLEMMRMENKLSDDIICELLIDSHQDLARFVIERMEIDFQKWKISNEIDEKLANGLSRSQTEYVLQEKLRTIQTELEDLGSDDATASDKASLRAQIENLKCPDFVKDIAQKEFSRYRNIPYSSPESLVSRNYLEWIIKLPWYPGEQNSADLQKVKDVLDEDHYGLKEIKEQIVEYVAIQNRRGKAKGNILCLVGAPGVGKTSLVKSIARAMGREYVRVCLGGVRDESEIRGHRRTYIGSLPGKIIKEMSKLKTNDPVILLDEIDKMSSDVRGDPASALLEVLDPEQNRGFTDHYLDLPYDLSNVLFVATANSTDFQRPLLDRMDVINIPGYSNEEKFNIAKQYLIPRLSKDNSIKDSEFAITDDTILHVITDYTREQGVRNLGRELDRIFRKAVVKLDLDKVHNKIEVKPEDLLSYLGPKKNLIAEKGKDQVGRVNGLAYSETGGDLLPIEAVSFAGKGGLKLTGKLGEVIKESCEIAFTAVKSKLSASDDTRKLVEDLEKKCIHIHFPDGSTPKDGPSAGIAIASVLYSILTGKLIRSDFALTGEVSLLGKVMPIGGLKEKLQGAVNSKVSDIILPEENRNDVEKVPEAIRNQLRLHYVEDLDQVFELIFR